MFEYIDTWKSTKVFQKQLELNKKELAGPYPAHWNSFLSFMSHLYEKQSKLKLLDVGCGCGAMSALCSKHIPDLAYTGIDYSLEAVELARETWSDGTGLPCPVFWHIDYKALDMKTVAAFDVLLASSLHNVLPDADECMKFLLSLRPKNLILLKVLVHDAPSEWSTYTAYDEIVTYAFHHNHEGLLDLFRDQNYSFREIKESGTAANFLLTRAD